MNGGGVTPSSTPYVNITGEFLVTNESSDLNGKYVALGSINRGATVVPIVVSDFGNEYYSVWVLNHGQDNGWEVSSLEIEADSIESAIEQAGLNLGASVQCVAVVPEEENHQQASIDLLQSLIQPTDYIYRVSSAPGNTIGNYLCKVTSAGRFSILVDENGKAFKGTTMQVQANVDPPAGYPTVVIEANITDSANFTIESGSLTYTFANNRGTPTPSTWYAESDLNL